MYGASIKFDLPPSPENAERIARTLAEALKFVWCKVAGREAMLFIDRQANAYVQQGAKFYTTRLARTELPRSIAVSPWALEEIEWWPMVTTDGAALELRVKVTSAFRMNSPYDPSLISQFRSLDICQFDPDETLPPDPVFVAEDFRSNRQYQQFLELRGIFLYQHRDLEELRVWNGRRELDQYGWRDLWLNGTLLLVFNMSALAYLISSICEDLPVAGIQTAN